MLDDRGEVVQRQIKITERVSMGEKRQMTYREGERTVIEKREERNRGCHKEGSEGERSRQRAERGDGDVRKSREVERGT